MSQFSDEIDVEFRKWTAMMLDKKDAEITRLREELAAVTAERDRMREALKRIDGMATTICMRADAGYGMTVETVMPIYEIARAAIEGVKEPASPWRDIESAPRDGTKILAWFTWPGRHSVEMARWQSNEYAKQPKPYWTCDNERLHGIIATRAAQPTHWMPLPEPPANTQTGDSR